MTNAPGPDGSRPDALPRRLGLLDASTIVAGSMIGSGIFIVSAEATRRVPSALGLLLVWLFTAVVTVAGAWVGFLLVRRMLGFEALDWSPPITGVATVVVLQVPSILDGLVGGVGRQPGRPDNIGRGPL